MKMIKKGQQIDMKERCYVAKRNMVYIKDIRLVVARCMELDGGCKSCSLVLQNFFGSAHEAEDIVQFVTWWFSVLINESTTLKTIDLVQ